MKRITLALHYWVLLAALLAAPLPALADAGQAEVQAWFDEIESTAPVTRTALTAGERKQLLDDVSGHKVASLAQLTKYDPPPGDTGFCFGRAMASHLMARKLGLAPGSIRKLFIVGDMGVWRFQVTTLVLGAEDGKLYAIDPVMKSIGHETPMTADQWIEIVQNKWDPAKKCRLYLTDPFTIIADMRVVHGKDFETGEYLFEIKFDPAGKPGFEPFTFEGTAARTVYRVSQDAQLAYFLRVRDSLAEHRFAFLKLEMKVLKGPETIVRVFDFRNYFVDLLDDLRQPARPALAGAEPHDAVADAADSVPALHGIRSDHFE